MLYTRFTPNRTAVSNSASKSIFHFSAILDRNFTDNLRKQLLGNTNKQIYQLRKGSFTLQCFIRKTLTRMKINNKISVLTLVCTRTNLV